MYNLQNIWQNVNIEQKHSQQQDDSGQLKKTSCKGCPPIRMPKQMSSNTKVFYHQVLAGPIHVTRNSFKDPLLGNTRSTTTTPKMTVYQWGTSMGFYNGAGREGGWGKGGLYWGVLTCVRKRAGASCAFPAPLLCFAEPNFFPNLLRSGDLSPKRPFCNSDAALLCLASSSFFCWSCFM